MSLEAKSRIYKASGDRKSRYILIPSEIATDSQFPFGKDGQVCIRIDKENKRLIIDCDCI